MVDLFRTKKWDLIRWRNVYFALSLLVIVPGLIAWCIHGFNLGIDFTGGGLITYQLAQPMRGEQAQQAEDLSKAIAQQGIENTVQIAGSAAGRSDQILVRTRIDRHEQDTASKLDKQDAAITALLQKQFPAGVTEAGKEVVSPVVSSELVTNAVYAVLWGCIFILILDSHSLLRLQVGLFRPGGAWRTTCWCCSAYSPSSTSSRSTRPSWRRR